MHNLITFAAIALLNIEDKYILQNFPVYGLDFISLSNGTFLKCFFLPQIDAV